MCKLHLLALQECGTGDGTCMSHFLFLHCSYSVKVLFKTQPLHFDSYCQGERDEAGGVPKIIRMQ